MGFLDFLYKPRTRIGERYPPSNEYHQKRITTHVRSNSVPNRRKQAGPSTVQTSSNNHQNNSQSLKAAPNKSRKNIEISDPISTTTTSSNHNRNNRKSRDPQIEDDYTKLKRIESQVDSYIKHRTVLTNELDSIEQNLREIDDEFNQEFDQLVLTSNQKHVLQTGDRIMKKLNAALYHQSEPITRKKAPNKSSTLPGNERKHSQEQSSKAQSNPTTPTEQSKPLQNLNSGTNDLVHAQYAIIKTSTPNLDKSADLSSRFMPMESSNIYIQNQTNALVEDYSGLDNTDWSFYDQQPPPPPIQQLQQQPYQMEQYEMPQRIASPKMYLNMTMTMHSDNPTVEYCFRKTELLRPRILGYKSDHRYRVYHELNNEITKLFYRLKSIDEQTRRIFEKDINIALCELHNLSGVMERAIDCQNAQCDVCNSFNDHAEIQV